MEAAEYYMHKLDLYDNKVLVSLDENEALTIGVKKTELVTNDWTILDDFTLTYYGNGTDAYDLYTTFQLENYNSCMAKAVEARDDVRYINVTGSERTTLIETIEKYTNISTDKYDEAMDALTVATLSFANAKSSYDDFAAVKNLDIPKLAYAMPSKAERVLAITNAAPTTAAEASQKAEDAYIALREYYESHALAEGVEGAVNVTLFYLSNPNATENLTGWNCTGPMNENAKKESWTDSNGNQHYYFDGGNWSANSWTTTMSQTIDITEGRYLLTAKGRASANTKLTMEVGENSVEMPHVGASGNVFGYGWNDASVEFEIPEKKETEIIVKATTEDIHQWFSISDFRLVRISDIISLRITRDHDSLTITTTSPDAIAYYTMDGSTPTKESTKYTAPIILTENCIIKAIAIKEGVSSKTVTYIVDWFTVAPISIEQNFNEISMKTETERAQIYYTLDGTEPNSGSSLYTAPLIMTNSCTVKAIAMRENFNNSEVASYIYKVEDITVAMPTITHEGNIITLGTTTEEARVYYTLDGSTPTAESTPYIAPFEVYRNDTIKAIAVRDNYFDSQVATLAVDWFTVDNVTFAQEGYVVTMGTATADATIHYTLNGTDPTSDSPIYTEPLAMGSSCIIKAIAIHNGYNDSKVSSYVFSANAVTVATPTITRDGNSIVMSTPTDGATIHYTLDGTDPTSESDLYDGPFLVWKNGIVKAVALRENYFDSQVASFSVDWFTSDADKDVILAVVAQIDEEKGTQETGLTTTRTLLQSLQEQAQKLQPQCDTLQAMHGCMTLDLGEAEASLLESRMEAALNGARALPGQISATDGLAQRAIGKADSLSTVLNGIRTELAAAMTVDEVNAIETSVTKAREGLEDIRRQAMTASEEAEQYQQAMVTAALEMGSAEAEMTAHVTAITCSYALRAEQLARLGRYPRLQHLDLSSASIEGNALPDRALSGLQSLICVQLPSTITTAGSQIVANCPSLAAIVWHSSHPVGETTLEGIDNPNLLLYVDDPTLTLRTSVPNVVANGMAQRIELTDNILADGTRGPANFYAPRPFVVQGEIAYTHTYAQTTQKGKCQGWETIALPFTVQTITHETNGEAIPFASYAPGKRPFWLCQLTELGFADADSLRAGVPYIISMPNSDEYSPFYRLGGKVRFAARRTTVGASLPQTATRGRASFTAAFCRQPASDGIFALNVGEERYGYAEGSLFVPGERDVYPFEAYRTTTAAATRYLSIADEMGDKTALGIRNLGLWLTDETVYSLHGVPVKNPGKGVYIKNNKKIIRK